jgi:ankyrin repeat protein
MKPNNQYFQRTELLTMIDRGKTEDVEKFLAENRQYINSKIDKFGRDPLLYACRMSNTDMMSLLIYYGANLESRDNHGRNAIHTFSTSLISSCEPSSDISQNLVKYRENIIRGIELLTNKGCDINAIDHFGHTSLDLAIRQNNPNATEIIVDKGGLQASKVLKKIIEEGDAEKLKKTLEILDIDSSQSLIDRFELLHLAVSQKGENNSNVIKVLFDKGADLSNVDGNENNPLHIAAIHNRDRNVIETLLQFSIRKHFSQTNLDGNTPEDLAKETGNNVFLELLEKDREKLERQEQEHTKNLSRASCNPFSMQSLCDSIDSSCFL